MDFNCFGQYSGFVPQPQQVVPQPQPIAVNPQWNAWTMIPMERAAPMPQPPPQFQAGQQLRMPLFQPQVPMNVEPSCHCYNCQPTTMKMNPQFLPPQPPICPTSTHPRQPHVFQYLEPNPQQATNLQCQCQPMKVQLSGVKYLPQQQVATAPPTIPSLGEQQYPMPQMQPQEYPEVASQSSTEAPFIVTIPVVSSVTGQKEMMTFAVPPSDFALLPKHLQEWQMQQQEQRHLASATMNRSTFTQSDSQDNSLAHLLIGNCRFCESNGETPAFTRSHVLHDDKGIVRCPVLRTHVCKICHATGDKAHTFRYCPILQQQRQKQLASDENDADEYYESRRRRYVDNRNSTGGYVYRKY